MEQLEIPLGDARATTVRAAYLFRLLPHLEWIVARPKGDWGVLGFSPLVLHRSGSSRWAGRRTVEDVKRAMLRNLESYKEVHPDGAIPTRSDGAWPAGCRDRVLGGLPAVRDANRM